MEKVGSPAQQMEPILAFRKTLADCRLIDLGFIGDPFTRKITIVRGIKEHLDRAWATA